MNDDVYYIDTEPIVFITKKILYFNMTVCIMH